MKSLKGHLLIATPRLTDPNFFRSIVLLVQHGDEGAMGLVLNRPLDTTVAAAWEQVSKAECQVDGFIHQGGPCDGPLMVVHTNEVFSDMEILPGVYFSADREAVEQLVELNRGEMRFFVGYSGWGPGQLEAELQEGAWLTSIAAADTIFSDEDRWMELSKQIGSASLSWLKPKIVPEDPTMN